jgi:hypothetical protein
MSGVDAHLLGEAASVGADRDGLAGDAPARQGHAAKTAWRALR